MIKFLTVFSNIDPTVIVAVLGVIGAIAAAIINNKSAEKIKKLELELKSKDVEKEQIIIKYDIVTQLLKFSQYQKIYDAVIKIMDVSKVDRFLMFIAINGKTELNNVTCIFQKYRNDESGVDAVAVYRGLKVDNTYVKMLKEMEREGEITVCTEELTPCLIKDIYESEKVTWSNWKLIGRINVDNDNDVIAFCSAATYSDKAYTNQDMLSIKLHFESSIKPNFLSTVKEMVKNKN
jgi:hypothetical protein